jgi:hypothetical protein
MLTREQQRLHRTHFWAEYKAIMTLYSSASGKKMNWLNYPTNIKECYLRLDATTRKATVTFDIQSKNASVRSILWEQMNELKAVMATMMNNVDVAWLEEIEISPGIIGCRILWELEKVNYIHTEDKQKIFDFFRETQLAFDEFYSEFGEIIILLAK